jgi:hypothetical protein
MAYGIPVEHEKGGDATKGEGCRPFNKAFVTRNPLRFADGPSTDEVIGANRLTDKSKGNTNKPVSGS